jgi:hypothetical protein
MAIRTLLPRTTAEDWAFTQELERLGLKVDLDGVVDPRSLENVRGGESAVRRLLDADGRLSHEAASRLDRAKEAITGFRIDVDARESANRSARTVAMTASGLAARLEAAFKTGCSGGAIESEEMERVCRQAKHTATQIWLHLDRLADAEPAAIKPVAAAATALSNAAAKFVIGLSERREAWLESPDPEQQAPMLASFKACAAALERVYRLASLLAAPAWKNRALEMVKARMDEWSEENATPTRSASAELAVHRMRAAEATRAAWLETIDRIEALSGLPRNMVVEGLCVFRDLYARAMKDVVAGKASAPELDEKSITSGLGGMLGFGGLI